MGHIQRVGAIACKCLGLWMLASVGASIAWGFKGISVEEQYAQITSEPPRSRKSDRQEGQRWLRRLGAESAMRHEFVGEPVRKIPHPAWTAMVARAFNQASPSVWRRDFVARVLTPSPQSRTLEIRVEVETAKSGGHDAVHVSLSWKQGAHLSSAKVEIFHFQMIAGRPYMYVRTADCDLPDSLPYGFFLIEVPGESAQTRVFALRSGAQQADELSVVWRVENAPYGRSGNPAVTRFCDLVETSSDEYKFPGDKEHAGF